ncbi:Polyphosphate kinase [Luteitalea pratensis]|uniref:Polyphosphate kinase n=1 Tax=Luteitalea pratensis TaxID=1855912 RepID=A0A143PS29_LUTPR|nr:polyphosphate kinase 1 [Luteitalea pratensis]AMY10639.1 Polyphosphate kinase [Luteitalea pratensis]
MNATTATKERAVRGRGAKRRIRLPATRTDWSQCDPANLEHPGLYINRELSWLEFNQRVLNQALDPGHPLLERVKFLAIVATNLDEFFMVRVATLLKKYRAGIEDVSPDGLNTEQQLAATRARSSEMMGALQRCWREQLRPALASEGVHILDPEEYTPQIAAHLAHYFRAEILPVLTPLAFDPGHPFPYISNLSRNFAVVVRHSGRTKFARVKIPATLDRFVTIPADMSPHAGLTFAFLEDIVRANLHHLFPGTDLQSAHLFRIIRDTDMVIQEDEADDLLESVDRSLKQLRYGALCLLEVEEAMPRRVLNILVENFEIDEDVVLRTSERMDWDDWHQLTRLHLPHLKDAPFSPRTIWSGYTEIFDDLREEDVLVHHPFDSFSSVEAFLRAAIEDPQVIAIKMTLYRIGANSPVVDMLVTAAEQGKQVAVLVELKARFDERNNIAWATRMESAGIHVVYGIVSLKTHGKLCLIIRKEPDGIRRYAHVATGNYNRATAQVYTDIGLFTSDSAIVDDISEVFNYLTGYSSRRTYDQLLVAPVSLRSQMKALIDRECEHHRAGRPARLIFKLNAIADPGMIRNLYRASQCGIPVDLIVRGVCCLRPGIPGISDTITVRSIVGRFLEHSRIYSFENGGDPEVYIGSADLMERNLDRRVEVLCPVHQPDLRAHLRDVVLETLLVDTDRARVLRTDGSYVQVNGEPGSEPINAQKRLLDVYSMLSSSSL